MSRPYRLLRRSRTSALTTLSVGTDSGTARHTDELVADKRHIAAEPKLYGEEAFRWYLDSVMQVISSSIIMHARMFA